MEIRALVRDDVRDQFSSGQPDIDEFLQRYAGQNQFRHHIGVTYVALARETIIAYFTVSAGHVTPDGLPDAETRRLPASPAPIMRLARLGVDTRMQRRGLGTKMLSVVGLIATEMRVRVGCVGVLVDSKPETVSFYEKNDFQRAPLLSRIAGAGPRPITLFADAHHFWGTGSPERAHAGPEFDLVYEFRRRARELRLTPEQIARAVDELMWKD